MDDQYNSEWKQWKVSDEVANRGRETDQPKFFWDTISSLENKSIFVLLSHGDTKGPLAVKGTSGGDIDLTTFS